MPTPDPSRRDEMILPTFVDLEELLFSSMRLHETRGGSEHRMAPAPGKGVRDKTTNERAS